MLDVGDDLAEECAKNLLCELAVLLTRTGCQAIALTGLVQFIGFVLEHYPTAAPWEDAGFMNMLQLSCVQPFFRRLMDVISDVI